MKTMADGDIEESNDHNTLTTECYIPGNESEVFSQNQLCPHQNLALKGDCQNGIELCAECLVELHMDAAKGHRNSSSSSSRPIDIDPRSEICQSEVTKSADCSLQNSLVETLPTENVENNQELADSGDNLTLNTRLRRKKAVKIKRSRTDEGCKKLVFRRCNSLLSLEKKTLSCAPESTLHSSINCSIANKIDNSPSETRLSNKLMQSSGESDSDVLSGTMSTEELCLSPFKSHLRKCVSSTESNLRDIPSPVEPADDCFSPVEDHVPFACLSANEPQLDHLSAINLHVRDSLELVRNVAKKEALGADVCFSNDQKKTKSTGTNLKSDQKTLSQSGVGNLALDASKDPSLSEVAAKKRGMLFRRKSSLAEEERKPVTKRIFGTSKKPHLLLRKYSLASEYFTLKFDSVDDGEEHMVAALKGVSLWQALTDVLQRRGLNPNQVDVFLDSSKTPLPLTSDCFLLANTALFVKAKDDEKRPGSYMRMSSVSNPVLANQTDSSKEKKQQNGSIKSKKSISSEESSFPEISPYSSLSRTDIHRYRGVTGGGVGMMTPGVKGHSKLQSLFSPFSKVQDKQEQLNELLTSYSLNGLPKMPDLLTLGRPHYDSRVFFLESHWTDIVTNHHTLNKRQRDQQEAIWELLTTEVEYIHKLKVIMDLFMCCLFNLQNEQLLNEIEVDKLFSNIGDVFYATCHFWSSHMSQVLKQARERRELLNPSLLKAGFLVFEKIFEPYTKYCLEQDNCREYIKLKTKENELFRTFIVWAESQKQCNRLKLVDLIVKPFQRLTKYKLLLYAMRKPLDKMDVTTDIEEQKKDINIMVEQVENFVFKVNVAMRQRHDYKQMSQMIDRIESYEAIEAPSEECIKLVSKFCKLDLTCPVPGCGQQQMRILLLEGNLKLRDTYSKMDVYCFLFTDMLLITKPMARRGDRVKVIKPPMRLDKIVVHSLRDVASFMLLYLNEYHMAQAVYTFHGDSKLWLENVIKAQNDYKEKRNSFIMRTDVYDDADDECAIYIEHASSADVSRHDSSSSTDIFLPNYGVQRSTSCIEDQSHHRTIRLQDDCRPSSAMQVREQIYRSQLSVPTFFDKDSSTESPTNELKVGQYLTVPSVSLPNCDAKIDASELDCCGSDNELEANPVECKSRLNQRRSGRERRYHTADTIQEIKNEKDKSIQKRLSWNCGNVAANLEDRDKLFGSPSLLSMPSSSGVSSTASLQIAIDGECLENVSTTNSHEDSDISGQIENNITSGLSNITSEYGYDTGVKHCIKMMSIQTQTSQSDLPNISANSPDRQVEDLAWNGTTVGQMKDETLSKSLPNLATVIMSNHAGEHLVPDASRNFPATSMPATPTISDKRRLSGSQAHEINKELCLVNSTLEASEV